VADWDIAPDSVWWFPLAPMKRLGVLALDAREFDAALGAPWLMEPLAGHSVERVLYFREFADLPVLEQPLDQVTFRYHRAEGYWCDVLAGS